ncbi:hypothetical protein [Sorangium sp. So ce1097]
MNMTAATASHHRHCDDPHSSRTSLRPTRKITTVASIPFVEIL